MMVAIYNWTGFYLGVSGGGIWGTGNVSGVRINPTGGIFGLTGGYNWQAGAMVFGLEGDFSWVSARGTASTGVCVNCDLRASWLGTIRGRLGYAVDRFMPYITGGVAFSEIRTNGGAFFPGVSRSHAGWTLGAGVEFAFAQNWTGKLEYLYADLGRHNCGLLCPGPLPNDIRLTTNIFRGGVNYKF